MRQTREFGERYPGRLPGLWLVFALGVMLSVLALPASAQLLPLDNIFPSAEEPAPQQSRPRTPLPEISFDPASVPTAQDYGALSGTVAEDDMIGRAQQGVELFRARALGILERFPDAVGEIATTLAAASPTGRPVYFVGIAIFAGLLLVVGNAVAQLFRVFVARRVFMAMQRPDPRGFLDKLPVLAYRIFLTGASLALTVLVAVVVGLVFYDEHRATLQTVLAVFGIYGATLMIDTIWRMALAPYLPEYRLPDLDDADARKLYRWVSASSAFGIASSAFCYWVLDLGLPVEVHVLITLGLTLVTVIALLAAIQANRRTISRIILAGRSAGEASWMARLAAVLAGPLAAVYLLIAWGDLAFRMVMGIEAGPGRLIIPYLVLMAGMMVYALTIYAIERVFARQRRIREINEAADARREAATTMPLEGPAPAHEGPPGELPSALRGDGADIDDDGDEEGGGPMVADDGGARIARSPTAMRTMEDLARRVASLFAIGAGAYTLLRFWGGADLILETALFRVAIDVIDVLFIGYIVFHATRIWLDQKIEEEGGFEDTGPAEGEGGGAGASRLATLLPLVRNAILAVIAVTVGLLIAMDMGVNVAPLFAGAGIVGLAIGFGAQALVRDIISGAFFLLDDAFRKGEYIDVGDVKGTVEKISIRSFQLRHHLGMLHTIPFGEIKHLTNFSRDWVIMKLPLRLTYDTDVERVRKLIKKLGVELMSDPVVGEKFLQPLKSQGVIQMEDSAMIVRIKFMTRPGDQWVIRKRVFAEIRELFEREGVHFAHREVTVRIPDLPEAEEITPERSRAIGAAARNAIDVVESEQLATGTGGPRDDR